MNAFVRAPELFLFASPQAARHAARFFVGHSALAVVPCAEQS